MQNYQAEILRTVPAKMTKNNKLSNFSMGLAGESGELVDMIKKMVYQGHPPDRTKIEEEIGDVLWYLGNIANCFDINLFEAMEKNIAKLRVRYPSGFDKSRSVGR